MGTTLVLSNAFSPLSHRHRHGNERTHLHRRPTSTLKPSFNECLLNSPFPSGFSSLRKFRLVPRTSLDTETSSSHDDHDNDGPLGEGLVGEESAAFDFGEQKISSWIYFSLVLGVVLVLLDLVWIDNSTGLGKAFIDTVSELSDSHEVSSLFFFFFCLPPVCLLREKGGEG
jgi:zeta-carotene isomerase